VIINEALSDETIAKFYDALNQTRQKHVYNFICGNGQRATDFGDDWPLYCYRTEISRLYKNRASFVQLVDSANGLLDNMFTVGCVNDLQMMS